MIRRFWVSRCARFASRVLFLGLLSSALLFSGQIASAATFFGYSSDGHPVSASADVSAVGDTLTVKLTNTTASTLDAGELFTGLDFSVSGLTPTLTSAMGVLRDVLADGTFSDLGSSSLSWSLASLGGDMWQLNFNPDAEHAIIGPPSGGDYSGANGSIKANAGHNPFAAEMATFVLDVPGLSGAPLSSVVVKTFRFGTNLDPGVPEPTTFVLAVLGFALARLRRR